MLSSSAGDKQQRRGRGFYLLANTEGDDECGRYETDASQPLIKRRFDDTTRELAYQSHLRQPLPIVFLWNSGLEGGDWVGEEAC